MVSLPAPAGENHRPVIATREQIELFLASVARHRNFFERHRSWKPNPAVGITPNVEPARCWYCEMDEGFEMPADDICCAWSIWSIAMEAAGLPQRPVLVPVETVTTTTEMTFGSVLTGECTPQVPEVRESSYTGAGAEKRSEPVRAVPALSAPAVLPSSAHDLVLDPGHGEHGEPEAPSARRHARQHREVKHRLSLGWPEYPRSKAFAAMWRGKCLERLNSALSERTLQVLNEVHFRTGQVEFSSDEDFDAVVEVVFSWASTGTRAHLWYDDLSGTPEELAQVHRGMEFVALPLSLLRADCDRVVTNFTRTAHTPHHARARADFLAGTWTAENFSAVPGKPSFLAFRHGVKSPEVPLSIADIEVFEKTFMVGTGRYAPLWRVPDEAFSERQAMLGRRSGAARKPDLSRLLEVPPGLTLAGQIAFLAELGVSVSESTLKREWKALLATGVVTADDPRRPARRGRPRKKG